jgi:hypothetical protein
MERRQPNRNQNGEMMKPMEKNDWFFSQNQKYSILNTK